MLETLSAGSQWGGRGWHDATLLCLFPGRNITSCCQMGFHPFLWAQLCLISFCSHQMFTELQLSHASVWGGSGPDSASLSTQRPFLHIPT